MYIMYMHNVYKLETLLGHLRPPTRPYTLGMSCDIALPPPPNCYMITVTLSLINL